ncbi:MAG: SGNH/GDSL hydrolase family protein [Alphaproteobacteria bacterium]|nr:SGNH/GDSL hydrolase family protein [Alphaproteobacteria bacterium]MBU1277901.1 SGNH/GDSL hydrolase family protein [Alphaproteobacteria bacterium]MBU1572620.1 SGNH/GDSL hydrolase family protein [Alphaproteobacteria bacterium]MBU1826894.1 SGNH/GDSL hydrolase family protein [Alphaproteobacteria bacterium]MBU2077149.1 SGNH/GDSL hydrolase family protein [Alphaproteobacteria bacterium]
MQLKSGFYGLLAALLCALSLIGAPRDAWAQTTQETASEDDAARILAIGDSMMAWHMITGNSIADALSDALGEPVVNRSVAGARILYGLPITGALGLKIAKQYHGKPWDWVVINGGGNDLWLGCGCGKCERKINRMVTKSGTSGDIPQLISRIRKTGARVVFVGYLRSPGVDSVIDACRPAGDALEARLIQMAEQMDGVYFLSIADLVPEGDRSYHGADMIHPSKKGSQAIGRLVADLIRKVDENR